jgi:hypothetical protein
MSAFTPLALTGQAASGREFTFHPLRSPLFAFAPPYEGLGRLSRGWQQRFQREYAKSCQTQDQPREETIQLEDGTTQTQWVCSNAPSFEPLRNAQGFFCCLPSEIPITQFADTLLDYIHELPAAGPFSDYNLVTITLANIPHAAVKMAVENSDLWVRDNLREDQDYRNWLEQVAENNNVPRQGTYILRYTSRRQTTDDPNSDFYEISDYWDLDYDDGTPDQMLLLRTSDENEVRLLLNALITQTALESIVFTVWSEQLMYDPLFDNRPVEREREFEYTYTLQQLPSDVEEEEEDEKKSHIVPVYLRTDMHETEYSIEEGETQAEDEAELQAADEDSADELLDSNTTE